MQQGRVLLDGHDVRNIKLQDLRQSIGMMFQDTFLFSNTVAANIAFGHLKWIWRKLSWQHVRLRLPHSSRPCRKALTRLSANTAQDSLADNGNVWHWRGTLLLNPQVLLLDDATAAVDAETEQAIQQSLFDILPGRTSLIVSNRLSTLCHMDRVIMLHDGQIVASGTPQRLLQQAGPFRTLWRRNWKSILSLPLALT